MELYFGQICRGSGHNLNVIDVLIGESACGDERTIGSDRNGKKLEGAIAAGLHVELDASRQIGDLNLRAGNNGTGRIGNRSLNGASGDALPERRHREAERGPA